MVRNRCRTTTRGNDTAQLEKAASEVKERHISVRQAAEAYGIPRTSLQRYINASSAESKDCRGYGNIAKAQRVFSEEQESELSDHIRAMDNLFHGLSAVKCRELAYRYGVANNVKIPPMWQDNQMGGNSTLIACWLA